MVRASDQERQQAIDLLTKAAKQGRLPLDEFGQRCQQAFAAVSQQDLAFLFVDLPQEVDLEQLVVRTVAASSAATAFSS